jgi:hypothetical protein
MNPGPMKTSIRCFECDHGVLERKVVEHDVGSLLGMDEVRVTNLPALVCPRCKAVSVEGEVLDLVALGLAAHILKGPVLDGVEVRFLRKLLGDTQNELAERLGVDRATVNRWENSSEPLTGAQAYAVRSHAFFRLRGRSPIIESAAESFVDRPKAPKGRYRLDGAKLQANAA